MMIFLKRKSKYYIFIYIFPVVLAKVNSFVTILGNELSFHAILQTEYS